MYISEKKIHMKNLQYLLCVLCILLSLVLVKGENFLRDGGKEEAVMVEAASGMSQQPDLLNPLTYQYMQQIFESHGKIDSHKKKAAIVTDSTATGWIYADGYSTKTCEFTSSILSAGVITNVCIRSTTNGTENSLMFSCDTGKYFLACKWVYFRLLSLPY
jgi:hypothetical protein